MKKQLQKKIYAFPLAGISFIITAMMFSASVNAQVVYTDIVPDSTYTFTSWTTHTYNLDLNGDGTTDFLIKAARSGARGYSGSYVNITPQGSNAFITTTLNTVKKLVPGDAISSSQAWHTTTVQYLKSYSQNNNLFPPITTNTGEWNNVVDGYVGLQLISGGQTYYGWVRMDVTVSMSSASLTIKDYAYNSIPNQPILAGQTTTVTGIMEDSFASSINLFPNPAKNQLTIELPNATEEVKVTIAEITGKIIYTTKVSEIQKLYVNIPMIIEKEGIYIVQIQSADLIATKKLIVEK